MLARECRLTLVCSSNIWGVDAAVWARRSSSASGGKDGSDLENSAKMLVMTPAEAVRQRYRMQGLDALLLDEQQWTMYVNHSAITQRLCGGGLTRVELFCRLDRALNPEQYEWMKKPDASSDKDQEDAVPKLSEIFKRKPQGPIMRRKKRKEEADDEPPLPLAVEKFRYGIKTGGENGLQLVGVYTLWQACELGSL